MEMEERDFVTFTDEDGNEFELDVIEYFEYEGQEYAVLMDLGADDVDEGEEDEDEEEEDEDPEIRKPTGEEEGFGVTLWGFGVTL